MDVLSEKSVKCQTNYFHLPHFFFSLPWLLPQQILKGDISVRPRKWPVWLSGLRWTCSSSLPSVLFPFLSVSPSVGSSSQPIMPWTTAFPVRSPPTPDHHVPLCEEQSYSPWCLLVLLTFYSYVTQTTVHRGLDGPPQRELDAFLEQWISVDEEVEDLPGFSLFSSVFLVLIRFSLCKHWALFLSSQTLSTVCVSLSLFFFFSFPPCDQKNTSNKPQGFCLYLPWISQQCCSWVHSTGSALSQGPVRTHRPYWNCPRKVLPVCCEEMRRLGE